MQHLREHSDRQPQIRSDLLGRERAVGAGEAREQIAHRIDDGHEVGIGDARGQHGAESVTKPASILDRCCARATSYPHGDCSSLGDQLLEPLGSDPAFGCSCAVEGSENAQQVGSILDVPRTCALAAMGEIIFDFG